MFWLVHRFWIWWICNFYYDIMMDIYLWSFRIEAVHLPSNTYSQQLLACQPSVCHHPRHTNAWNTHCDFIFLYIEYINNQNKQRKLTDDKIICVTNKGQLTCVMFCMIHNIMTHDTSHVSHGMQSFIFAKCNFTESAT